MENILNILSDEKRYDGINLPLFSTFNNEKMCLTPDASTFFHKSSSMFENKERKIVKIFVNACLWC